MMPNNKVVTLLGLRLMLLYYRMSVIHAEIIVRSSFQKVFSALKLDKEKLIASHASPLS